MKKARIFFGVSLFVLAVVGVVATKANTKITPYYYDNAGTCVEVTDVDTDCTTTATNQCYYLGNSSLPMYATNDGGICRNPLKRNN